MNKHCIYIAYTMYIHVCTCLTYTCTCIYYVHTAVYMEHACTYMYMIYVIFLHRWTQEQLKKVIAMLQDPAFDSKDIDPDLHKRMDKAVQDGRIKCFNMRDSFL